MSVYIVASGIILLILGAGWENHSFQGFMIRLSLMGVGSWGLMLAIIRTLS